MEKNLLRPERAMAEKNAVQGQKTRVVDLFASPE